MTVISDDWQSGEAGFAYENFMGRWSRRMAKEFIHWLTPPAAWNWLEVGCGTGALTQAILDTAPASIVACDPSEKFVAFARRSLSHPTVSFQTAGADAAGELPHRAGGFDAVVAGLVLNFIPAPVEVVQAMRSRLRPGGMLAAYVWDYAEGMQFLRVFWDAVVELDPDAADLDEGPRFPLCRPGALVELLKGEGFQRVEGRSLEISTPFADFDDYWIPFLGGIGPGPAYVVALPDERREKLRLRLKQRLAAGADGAIRLTARAWAVRGYRD